MSIWDDLKNKGLEIASEAINSAIPVITEKIEEAVKSALEGKKEDDVKKKEDKKKSK